MEMKERTLRLKAFAKINLTLEVLSERPDGYHELRTVMHSIGIYDTVTLTAISGGRSGIEVVSNVPLPYNNTARRAAEAYAALENCPAGRELIRIGIEKRIPSEAGLGGGSADAAAVLRALETLYGAAGEERLFAIAAKIGADVPFCLKGGCALCEGIGERLTDLPPAKLPLVIAKGERGVSTGALFRSLKQPEEAPEDRSMPLVRALESGENGPEAIAGKLVNDLAPQAEALVSEIAALRRRMLELGALDALMTGSGSAVYGVFRTEEEAMQAESELSCCAFCRMSETKHAPFEIEE